MELGDWSFEGRRKKRGFFCGASSIPPSWLKLPKLVLIASCWGPIIPYLLQEMPHLLKCYLTVLEYTGLPNPPEAPSARLGTKRNRCLALINQNYSCGWVLSNIGGFNEHGGSANRHIAAGINAYQVTFIVVFAEPPQSLTWPIPTIF